MGVVFSGDKTEKGCMCSLGWTEPQQALVCPHHPWENERTATAGSGVASSWFCACEFVFPLHPLINCLIEFCGFSLPFYFLICPQFNAVYDMWEESKLCGSQPST